MKVNHLSTAMTLLLVGFAGTAFASGSVDGEIDVTADISVSCSFDDSPTTLDFGSIDLTVDNAANTSLSITCSDSATVDAVAAGLNDSSVIGYDFAMDDGSGHLLGYNLYTTAGHSVSWLVGMPVPLTSGAATMNFWGYITGGDQAGYSGGTHVTDTVTVTVTY